MDETTPLFQLFNFLHEMSVLKLVISKLNSGNLIRQKFYQLKGDQGDQGDQGTVGQTPWKPFLSKLKNHLKTFKMHQKIISHLNFVYNLSTNDKNSKILHAKVTCEVLFL